MSESIVSHLRAKRIVGALVLLALVAAAVIVTLGRRHVAVTNEGLAATVQALPGIAETIGFKFDNRDYSGQTGARVVAIDFVVKSGADGKTLLESMKSMGAIATDALTVYQRVIATGYRGRAEFDAGLPFAARAVWITGEIAAPLEGWTAVRLPDEAVPPEKALTNIYSKPSIVSAGAGALTATLDLNTERLKRPAADIREILASGLLNCYDYDNVFLRSPGLKSIDVTILRDGQKVAHLAMTREAFEAIDTVALTSDLSSKVLAISDKEVVYAQKYDGSGLFTPLLFDRIVSAQDKAALKALEDERAAAEDSFYRALFARASYEVADSALRPAVDSTASR